MISSRSGTVRTREVTTTTGISAVAGSFFNRLKHFEAAQIRHPEIQEYDVRPVFASGANPLRPAGGFHHQERQISQPLPQQVTVPLLIVDDQHLHHGRLTGEGPQLPDEFGSFNRV